MSGPFKEMADLETEACLAAGHPQCKYCGAVARKPRNKFSIFHKDSCGPAREYDKETKTYRIEREMPDVDHCTYAPFFHM